jgi:DNA-binding transcriptional regulator YiaG
MTGNEMFEILRQLDWSPAALARRLSVRVDTVRQWLNSRREIPPNLAEWLIDLHNKLLEKPLPDGWSNSGA